MQIIYDLWWLWIILFLISLFYIINEKIKSKKINSQFVVTGTVLLIFYIICFLSAICNILAFLWRWIL